MRSRLRLPCGALAVFFFCAVMFRNGRELLAAGRRISANVFHGILMPISCRQRVQRPSASDGDSESSPRVLGFCILTNAKRIILIGKLNAVARLAQAFLRASSVGVIMAPCLGSLVEEVGCQRPYGQYRGQFKCGVFSCGVPVIVCASCSAAAGKKKPGH